MDPKLQRTLDEDWQSPRVLSLSVSIEEDNAADQVKGFGVLFSSHAVRQRDSSERAIARMRGSTKAQRPVVAFGTNISSDIDFRFEIPQTSILKRQVLEAVRRPPSAASLDRTKGTTVASRASSNHAVASASGAVRPSSAMSIYATHTDARAVVETRREEDAAQNVGVSVTRVPSRMTVAYDKYGERIRGGPQPETFRFPNTFFTYHGHFKNNVKDGEGRLTLADGGSYVGEFKDGEIVGQGVRTWPDGTTYRGAFLDGEMHGFGVYQSGSSTYEGEFCRGVRHGAGTLRQPHVTYVGDFVDHKFHGYGVLKSAPKSVSGHFVRGLLQGTARVKYANGDTFVGDYFEDTEHGNGTFVSAATKVTYIGQMIHGARAYIPNSLVLRELRAVDQPMGSLASPGGASQHMASISMGFRFANKRLSVSIFSPKAALKVPDEGVSGFSDDDDDRASNDSKSTTLAISVAPKSVAAQFAPSPVVPADGNYNVALAWGRPFPIKAGRRFEIGVMAAFVADDQYVTPPPRWPVGSTMGALPSNAALSAKQQPPTPASRAGSTGGRLSGPRGAAATVASVTLSTVRYGLFTNGEAQPYEIGRGVTLEMYAINPKRKDALGVLAQELIASPTALPGEVVYHPNEAQSGGPEAYSCLASRQALIDGADADNTTADYIDHIMADVAQQRKEAQKRVPTGTSPQPLSSTSAPLGAAGHIPRLRIPQGKSASISCSNLAEAMAASVNKFRAEVFPATPRTATSPEPGSADLSVMIPHIDSDAFALSIGVELPDPPQPYDVVKTETNRGVAKFTAWLSSQAPVGEYLAVIRFATNVVAPRPNGAAIETPIKPLLLPFYVNKCL